jgi:hypothetical protein
MVKVEAAVARPGDSTPYFDVAEASVAQLFAQRGLSPNQISGKEFRGLCALVGAKTIPAADAAAAVSRLSNNPKAITELLDARRISFMTSISKRYGIAIEDGKGKWSVQELANVDFLFSQLPDTFLGRVRRGPPLRREADSDTVTGLYNPLSNRVTLYNGFNAPDDANLATVKDAEKHLRTTVLMEIGHAWQIRGASHLNPGIWGGLVGLVGVVWPKSDLVSEWAQISSWTVKPKWSIASLFGRRSVPNLGTGSGAMKDVKFAVFGRKLNLGNVSDLRFEPSKETTFVSAYSKSDPYEDFGESLDAYFADPAALKRHSPEKYAYIRDKVMNGREFKNAYGIFQ